MGITPQDMQQQSSAQQPSHGGMTAWVYRRHLQPPRSGPPASSAVCAGDPWPCQRCRSWHQTARLPRQWIAAALTTQPTPTDANRRQRTSIADIRVIHRSKPQTVTPLARFKGHKLSIHAGKCTGTDTDKTTRSSITCCVAMQSFHSSTRTILSPYGAARSTTMTITSHDNPLNHDDPMPRPITRAAHFHNNPIKPR